MLNLLNALDSETMWNLIGKGFGETLYITLLSTLFAYIIGLPLGIILNVTSKKGITPNRPVNLILGFIVNFLRSVPFLILLVAIIPFTRAIVGTFIGTTAAIVPLTVSAFPFVARMVESSLSEVEFGKIEAGQSMGTSNFMLMWKVLLPESLPSLITNATIVLTTVLGYSAMVGVVAGGGLGQLALDYGYARNETLMMWICIVFLFLIVMLFQYTGAFIAKKIDRRK